MTVIPMPKEKTIYDSKTFGKKLHGDRFQISNADFWKKLKAAFDNLAAAADPTKVDFSLVEFAAEALK